MGWWHVMLVWRQLCAADAGRSLHNTDWCLVWWVDWHVNSGTTYTHTAEMDPYKICNRHQFTGCSSPLLRWLSRIECFLFANPAWFTECKMPARAWLCRLRNHWVKVFLAAVFSKLYCSRAVPHPTAVSTVLLGCLAPHAKVTGCQKYV